MPVPVFLINCFLVQLPCRILFEFFHVFLNPYTHITDWYSWQHYFFFLVAAAGILCYTFIMMWKCQQKADECRVVLSPHFNYDIYSLCSYVEGSFIHAALLTPINEHKTGNSPDYSLRISPDYNNVNEMFSSSRRHLSQSISVVNCFNKCPPIHNPETWTRIIIWHSAHLK